MLRIALIPVVMTLVLWDTLDHHWGYATIVFVVAASSDFFDGYLARRWEQVTTLGAFLDSIADKLLVTGALLALVESGRVWAWAAFVIIGREIAITGLRGVAAMDGTSVPASNWGKLKAWVQYFAIGFAMLRFPDEWGPFFFDQWLILAAVVVTVLSAVSYFSHFGRVLKTNAR